MMMNEDVDDDDDDEDDQDDDSLSLHLFFSRLAFLAPFFMWM